MKFYCFYCFSSLEKYHKKVKRIKNLTNFIFFTYFPIYIITQKDGLVKPLFQVFICNPICPVLAFPSINCFSNTPVHAVGRPLTGVYPTLGITIPMTKNKHSESALRAENIKNIKKILAIYFASICG